MPQVAAPADFDAFRATARALLADRIPPQDVTWAHAAWGQLFDEPAYSRAGDAPMPSVPRELVQLLEAVTCYRFDGRWALMYRVLWRTRHENRELFRDAADPDVSSLTRMAAAVRQDVHRMHAFLRFRETDSPEGPRYVAWYEPQHLVLERAAPFFVERFANLRWMIATPDGALDWNGTTLTRAPSPPPGTRPAADAGEELWCTYFASVFDAARANPRALARHLPKRYWRNLPEAREIERILDDGGVARERLLAATPVPEGSGLRVAEPRLAAASARVRARSLAPEALDAVLAAEARERAVQRDAFEPAAFAGGAAANDGPPLQPGLFDVAAPPTATARASASVPRLAPALPFDATPRPAACGAPRAALDACRNCALWQRATQPVAGTGPTNARLMLVGEAPGDQEDLEGRPFVGPAGTVLDEVLQDAGLERGAVYLTNSVKHFAWEPRGPRRLHRRPAPHEIDACNAWLREELDTVRPAVAVALGATALRALCGWRGSVKDARHEILHAPEGVRVIATWHPAAILRAPPEAAERMRIELVGDLVRAAREARRLDEEAGRDEDRDAADDPAGAAEPGARSPILRR